MSIRPISNEQLTAVDIPAPDADWSAISTFALSFDACSVHGSFGKCAEIANAHRSG
jgi:hypothetical protein